MAVVRDRYNAIRDVWPRSDYWHFHLHQRYRRLITANQALIKGGPCLNLGSASQDYAMDHGEMVYLDVADRTLPRSGMSVCGDAHAMPLKDGVFHSVIAIGSVINYCSPAEVFNEAHRVLRPGGGMLFDFEQVGAYEHLGARSGKVEVRLFETDFGNYDETIWLYGFSHVLALLAAVGFEVVRVHHIHVLTSVIWWLTSNNRLTAAACKVDAAFERLPILRRRSSSVFIVARKTT